jgi:hypothetical protein
VQQGLTSIAFLVLQATRQVTRAAIEWYGPDRPKFLGEYHEPSTSFRQKQFSTALHHALQPCTAPHKTCIAYKFFIPLKI